jgi:hypothetical protein
VAGRPGAYGRFGDDHLHICRAGGPFGPLSVAVSELPQLRPGDEVEARGVELRIGGSAISLDRVRLRGRTAPPGACRPEAALAAGAVRARLPPLPAALAEGRRALEAGDLPAAVTALAGRGEGLTPEGDDVLAALLAGDRAAALPALPALLRWGSSSGAALAHGMVSGAYLAPRPDTRSTIFSHRGGRPLRAATRSAAP